jgi:glycerol-3-phosphate dehydrogenase
MRDGSSSGSRGGTARPDRLTVAALDLLIVGGGITGLGVARLAARNGYRVALLDRGDLASGASSATSHMLHGGLRYLEHAQFQLVREALHERTAVAKMAPDLARPVRFLVPIYRGDPRPPWMVRLGLTLYDGLAGRARLASHSMARPSAVHALEPEIQRQGLRGAALYSDVVMDDVRLAIVVARDAAAQGAALHPYTEAIAARPAEGGAVEVIARDAIERAERRFVARVVVNAAGSWADDVRRRLLCSLTPGRPDPEPLLRPSRGVHLVFPPLTRGHGVLLTARSDRRVFFVIPFGEHTLAGTTEVEVASPPSPRDCEPTIEEVRYLRAELARAMPGPSRSPVLALTSGVRPLLGAAGGVGAASREHRVVDDGSVLTIVGGKYTTFRVMARDVLVHFAERHGRARATLRDPVAPLPRPLGPGQTVEAITEFAVNHEFARRLDDVLRRRTRLWLTPDRGRVAAPVVAATLARLLGWSAERQRDELQAFHGGLADEERLLARAWEET